TISILVARRPLHCDLLEFSTREERDEVAVGRPEWIWWAAGDLCTRKGLNRERVERTAPEHQFSAVARAEKHHARTVRGDGGKVELREPRRVTRHRKHHAQLVRP